MRVSFFRPPNRPTPPRIARDEIDVPPPNEIDEGEPQPKWRTVGLPVMMVVVVIAMVALMLRTGRQFNPMYIMFPMMMLLGVGGMALNGAGGGGTSRAQVLADRKSSTRALSVTREKAFARGLSMHEGLQYFYPDPVMLPSLIGTERMWEVMPTSDEFTALRYGLGEVELAARIVVPEAPPGEFLEPVSWVTTVRFLRHQSTVRGMPVALTASRFPVIGFTGDRDVALGLVRAMLLHAVVTHGPDNLAIVALTDEPDGAQWSWLKWLPHNQHPFELDRLGSARMSYFDWSTLTKGVGADEESGREGVADFETNFDPNREITSDGYRHVLVVVDSAVPDKLIDSAITPLGNVTWLLIDPPANALTADDGITLRCDTDGSVWRSEAERPTAEPIRVAMADQVSVGDARTVARQLARFEVATLRNMSRATKQVERGRDWGSLMRLRDPGALDPMETWGVITRYTDRRRLRIPIGFTQSGDRLELDIKQAAEGGTGPHGQLLGATGSGKSEFLRNVVANGSITHSPDMLNWLLVDYKGGATFLDMGDLPHVSAVITNMEQEAHLVGRMREMLNGEIERRYVILREANERFARSDIKDIRDYEIQRERGADLPPLPSLVVIIDEWAELLQTHPDFGDLFKRIGRVGRSVGIHLFFASQTLETAGRTSGLEANIGFKIGLKTLTAGDSRALLDGSDAAFRLPGQPGHGVLKVTGGDMATFYSGWTGAAYFPPAAPVEDRLQRNGESLNSDAFGPQPFTAAAQPLPSTGIPVELTTPERSEDEINAAPTVFTTVVERLKLGTAKRPYRMWLPPLITNPLDAVDPGLKEWIAPVDSSLPKLTVPFGLFDDPAHHAQPQWLLDVTGNALITGGSQMGKSTAVKTLVASLALSNTPQQVQMYIVDYAGGGLGPLALLPHVGTVATRAEPDAINRMLVQLKTLITDRERLFREHGIGTIAEYRKLRTQPDSPYPATDPYGDVYLIIDGWDAAVAAGAVLHFRGGEVEALISGALNYGVHLVLTTARTVEMRGIEPHIHTFVELHSDSEMSRIKAALAKLRRHEPGHAITTGSELQGLIALPRIDGVSDAASVGDGLAELVRTVARSFAAGAERVRTLPISLVRNDLAAMVPPMGDDPRRRLRLPLGIRESTLGVAYAEMYREPHLAIYGEPKSGKSELIGTIVEGISRQFATHDDAVIVLVDPRSRHLGCIDEKNVVATVRRDEELEPAINALIDRYDLTSRTVPAGITAAERKARSWWQGPEIFIVIDDYQIVAPRHSSPPVHELAPWMRNDALARGFHFVIARNSQGLMMSEHSDPILKQLAEDRAPAVLLSADKFDGAVGETKFERFGIPGRARYVETAFGRTERIQAAWSGVPEAEFDDFADFPD
ncbi:type VII secretion protein EccCa [Mycolicibacterium sp. XJ870]